MPWAAQIRDLSSYDAGGYTKTRPGKVAWQFLEYPSFDRALAGLTTKIRERFGAGTIVRAVGTTALIDDPVVSGRVAVKIWHRDDATKTGAQLEFGAD